MTTLLEIPLKGISPDILQGFQAKYPEAYLRIEADNRFHAGAMDEEQFWAIIDLFDWDKETNADIMQPAVEALATFPKADICTFHNILNEKLFALDGRRYAEPLGSNAYLSGSSNHFSVDDFLYARCGVVANGRRFFEEVLQQPQLIPKEFTFEQLLYLPDRAWKLKTGEESLDFFPEHSYETFSNTEGWPGIKPLSERLGISK